MQKFVETILKRVGNVGFQCLLPALLIGLWELSSYLGVTKSVLLPAPSHIIHTFIDLLLSGKLFHHLSISIRRVLQGYFLGSLFGIIIGVLCGLFPKIDTALQLILEFLRPIPVIAWVPVFILWLGIDETSKIIVIAVGSF